MRARSVAGIVAIALAVSVGPCGAQALEQPLRSAPPRDPDRTTSQLTLSASALGGYDDHLTASGGFTPSLETAEGGYTGFGEVALRYGRGRKARSFFLEGSSYLLTYSNLSMDSPVGGQVLAGGDATFGRSNRIGVVQYVRNDPYVNFGAFGPLSEDLGPGAGPDANPANGLTPNRSWGALSSASADWHWTQRTTLSTEYEYRRKEYVGDVGFDNRAHTARLTLDRSLTRNTSLNALYRYTDRLLVEPARSGNLPLTEQVGEIGFSYDKPLSPMRRMEISAGGGATHVATVSRFGGRELDYWTPSGYASLRADIGRTWAIDADYRRGLTFLDSITPEFFVADAVLLRTEGMMNSRVGLGFSAGYSNGGQPNRLTKQRYKTFTLAASADLVIAHPWSIVVSYNRSDYVLSGVAVPLEGSSSYDRNAIRVGMAYSFTLASSRTERRPRPGRTEN
jgi:hypothetical protein